MNSITAFVQEHVIPDWRRAWKFFSMHVALVAVILGGMPVDAQAAVMGLLGVGPERMPAVLGVLLIVARLIDQNGTARARPDDEIDSEISAQ